MSESKGTGGANTAQLTLAVNSGPALEEVRKLGTGLDKIAQDLANLGTKKTQLISTEDQQRVKALEAQVENLTKQMAGADKAAKGLKTTLGAGFGSIGANVQIDKGLQKRLNTRLKAIGLESAKALGDGWTKQSFSTFMSASGLIEKGLLGPVDKAKSALDKLKTLKTQYDLTLKNFGPGTATAQFGSLFDSGKLDAKIKEIQSRVSKFAAEQALAKKQAEGAAKTASQWMSEDKDIAATNRMVEARRKLIRAAIDEQLALRKLADARQAARDRTLDTQEFRSIYNAAKASPEAANYTAIGKAVYAAKVAVEKYGEAAARAFLGSNGYLVSMTDNLSLFERRTRQAAKATEDLASRQARLATANARWNQMLQNNTGVAPLRQQLKVVQDIEAKLAGVRKAFESSGDRVQGFTNLRGLVNTYGADAIRSVSSGSVSSKGLVDQINAVNSASNRGTQANNTLRDATRRHREEQAMLHSTLRGVAGGMDNLWLTYGRYVGHMIGAYAAVTAARKSISSGIEFDYQTRFVAALGDSESPNAYRGIQEGLYGIKDAPANVNELARSLRVLQQTGIDASQGLGLLQTVISASLLGETDLKTAAEDVVGVLEVFNLHSEDPMTLADNFRKAGDIMARVSQETKANLHDVATAFQAATGIASQYGVSIEFAAATMETLGKQGVVGSKAGTFTRNMVEELYQPRTQRAERALKKLNVSAYDEEGNVRKDIDVVRDLQKSLSKYNEGAQAKYISEIFGERGKKAIRGIISDLDAFENRMKSAADSTGLLGKQTDKLAESTQYQLKQLGADWDNLFTKAWDDQSLAKPILALRDALKGGQLQQLLTSTIQGLVGLGQWVAENSGAIVAFGKTLAVLAAGQLGLTVARQTVGLTSSLVSLGSESFKAGLYLKSLWAIASGSASAIGGGAGAISGMVSTIGLLGPAIGVVGAAVAAAGAAWYVFRDRSAEAIEAVRGSLKSLNVSIEETEGKLTRAIANRSLAGITEAADQAMKDRDAALKKRDSGWAELTKSYPDLAIGKTGGFTAEQIFSGDFDPDKMTGVLGALSGKKDALVQYRSLAASASTAYAKSKDLSALAGEAIRNISTTPEITSNDPPKAGPKGYDGGKDQGASRAASQADAQADAVDKYTNNALKRKLDGNLDALKIQLEDNVLTSSEYWAQWEATKLKDVEDRITSLNNQIAKTSDKGRKDRLALERDDLTDSKNDITAEAKRGALEDKNKLRRESEQVGLQAALKVEDVRIESLKKQAELKDELLTTSERELAVIKRNADAEYNRAKLALDLDPKYKNKGRDTDVMGAYQAQINALDAVRTATVTALTEEKTLRDAANESWEYGAQKGLMGYVNSIKTVAESTSEIFSNAFKGMEDSLVNFVTTGKLEFKDLANSIIADMVRMAIQQQVTKPLANLAMNFIGSLAGGSTSSASAGGSGSGSGLSMPSGGGISTSYQWAKGGAFNSGVEAFAKGGAFTNNIYNKPTMFKFANGSRFGVMGEAGPEAIMPLKRDSQGRLGVAASGVGGQVAAPVINISVNNEAAADGYQAQAKANTKDGKTEIELMIAKVIQADQRNNGPVTQGFSSMFGLNRAVR